MAEKVNSLVDNWNTNAKLNLTGEQEQQLKALLNDAVVKYRGRREAGKQAVEQLQRAVEGGDSAALGQVLTTFREGVRQAAEGREKFLDHFDQILQPEQRARVLLHLVDRAKETGQPLEHLVESLLTQTSEAN